MRSGFAKLIGTRELGIASMPDPLPVYPESGYLAIAYACNVSDRNQFNSEATEEPTYEANFGNILPFFGDNTPPWSYSMTNTTSSLAAEVSGIFPLFDMNRTYRLQGRNATWNNDTHLGEYEFLGQDGSVLFAIRTTKDGTFRSGLWYGPSLASLVKAPSTGTYPNPTGDITFSETHLIYTNTSTSTNGWTLDFTYACSPGLVRSVRSRVSALSTYNTAAGGTAIASLRLQPIGL